MKEILLDEELCKFFVIMGVMFVQLIGCIIGAVFANFLYNTFKK